jgi:hypothetical protein
VVGDGSEDAGIETREYLMKKLFIAAVLVLPIVAMPARADGCILPFRGNASLTFQWNISGGAGAGSHYYQLGPWYHYWPLEAHFVTPAPTGYPYWPPPQAPMPPANPLLPPPQPKPDVKPNAGPDVRPVGYYYSPYQTVPPTIRSGPAPSYWYSNP